MGSLTLAIIAIAVSLILIYGTSNSGFNLVLKPLLWITILASVAIPVIFFYLSVLAISRFVEIDKETSVVLSFKSGAKQLYHLGRIDEILIQKVWLLRSGFHLYYAVIKGEKHNIPLAVAMTTRGIKKVVVPVARFLGTKIETDDNVVNILQFLNDARHSAK